MKPINSPTPAEIRALRKSHSLTQTEAAQVVWSTLSTWQKWETGTRNMPQLTWWALKEKIRPKIGPMTYKNAIGQQILKGSITFTPVFDESEINLAVKQWISDELKVK